MKRLPSTITSTQMTSFWGIRVQHIRSQSFTPIFPPEDKSSLLSTLERR